MNLFLLKERNQNRAALYVINSYYGFHIFDKVLAKLYLTFCYAIKLCISH